MNKLLLILCILFIVFSCKKSDQTPVPVKIETPVNYIKYIFPSENRQFNIHEYTVINLSLCYNITIDELAPQGFEIWQLIRESDEKTRYFTNKKILTKRSDTIDFKFNLWEIASFKIGDTAWINSRLMRMKTSTAGDIISKSDSIAFIIIK